jgi:hypothetical protein
MGKINVDKMITTPGVVGTESAAHAMARYLETEDRIQQVMSLESIIKSRVEKWQQGGILPNAQIFPKEIEYIEA